MKMAVKKTQTPQTDAAIIAVLHQSGSAWRVLVASAPGNNASGMTGGKTGSVPTLIEAREFPREQADRINAWLNEERVGTVLCTLPASQVICRTAQLPNAAPEQLDLALRLQAESHLLGVAPPHRVAMAVLPAAAGETARSGIVLAWPESSTFAAPALSRPVRYVPDVAALAALFNGQRPADVLLALDRGDGSVALALTHTSGAIFRATQEDPANVDAWQKSVGRIVAETALSVGHSGAFIETAVQSARQKAASLPAGKARAFLPDEIIASAAQRLHGAPADPSAHATETWWSANGVAAGALLARTGPLAALTQMQHAPAVEKPSPVRAAAETLARPRAAATVVLAALLLLLFGPTVFAGLRLAVLTLRHGDIDAQRTAVIEARNQRDIYRELQEQKTWPMTKLLSDIATNTPLGIELEMMRVEAGKDFAVSGTVIGNDGRSPQELVAQMQKNLSTDGVFEKVAFNWGDANNLGVMKFDLNGKVVDPYRAPRYPVERDFDTWSHADRRDKIPPGGSDTDAAGTTTALASANTGAESLPPALSGDEGEASVTEETIEPGELEAVAAADETARRSSSSSGRLRGGEGRTAMPGTGSDGSAIPPSADIPAPVTEEQIKAWSLEEVQAHLGKVSKARTYVRDNPEESARLKSEFDMLMARLRELKSAQPAPEAPK